MYGAWAAVKLILLISPVPVHKNCSMLYFEIFIAPQVYGPAHPEHKLNTIVTLLIPNERGLNLLVCEAVSWSSLPHACRYLEISELLKIDGLGQQCCYSCFQSL